MASGILERYVPTKFCNPGVIFMLSKEDHKMYIYSGNSSKDIFTDKRRQAVFDSVKGNLQSDDYDQAIV